MDKPPLGGRVGRREQDLDVTDFPRQINCQPAIVLWFRTQVHQVNQMTVFARPVP